MTPDCVDSRHTSMVYQYGFLLSIAHSPNAVCFSLVATQLTKRRRYDILWVRKRKWPRRCWSTSGPGPQRKEATVDEASLAHSRARSPEEQPYRYPDAVEM